MTPNQYRAALDELGVGINAAGPWMGFSKRTSVSYAQGDTPIPEPTANLLRLVLALKLTPEKAAEIWSRK